MPSYGKCAGCRNLIKNREFLVCCSCNLKYDIECAQISSKRFHSFYAPDQDRKSNWKCPECCSKARKTGNSETPLRPPHLSDCNKSSDSDNSAPIQVENITMRSKPNIDSQTCASPPATSKDSVSCPMSDIPSENHLRNLIKEEIRQSVKAAIKELVAEQLQSINNQLLSFKDSMTFINKQYEDIKDAMNAKNDLIEKLRVDNERLVLSVNDITNRLGQAEQHMRECNIELNGVPEHSSENLSNTVMQLARTVDCPITKDDIQKVTRIAKVNRDTNRPRAIVVKLRNVRQRDSLLVAAYKFNKNKKMQEKLNSQHLGIGGNTVPVYISEHLTPVNKQLHAAVRQKAKESSYKFVWVRDGRIYMRKDEYAPAKFIRGMDDLKNLS